MNKRNTLIGLAVILASGLLYKFFCPTCFTKNDPVVCVYYDQKLGKKSDAQFLLKSLKEIGISKDKISENPQSINQNTKVNVFLDQNKFDEFFKLDNSTLKVAVRLKDSYESRENNKVVGAFDYSKYAQLLELMQKIIPNAKTYGVVYDNQSESVKNSLKEISELCAAKGINVKQFPLEKKHNLATDLKDIHDSIQAVIIIPNGFVTLLDDAEIILQHFKTYKIPVFADNIGLIKAGALAGFAYDTQEMFYAISQIIDDYIKSNKKDINDDLLSGLAPQLHLNMDTVKEIGITISSGVIDEAITVGSADL